MGLLLKLCCILLLLNNPKGLLDQLPECSENFKLSCPENFKVDIYNDFCRNTNIEKPDHTCNSHEDCNIGRSCSNYCFCQSDVEKLDHTCKSDIDCSKGRHCSIHGFCHNN